MKNKPTDSFERGISTLAGANPYIIRKLEAQFDIEAPYKKKWRKSKLIAHLMHSLAAWDRWRYNRLKQKLQITQPPLFVIGHWRSGTTLMHNMLCELTDSAYCTTYQNIFPNNLFFLYPLLRGSIQLQMPANRPGDNLPLHTLLPQEEEFALGNMSEYCFYHWMYFPQQTLYFMDKYLTAKTATQAEKKMWQRTYMELVKRSILRNGGTQFVSKNPPNTARIDMLLELFPHAKFIFLHRNIYDTIRSSVKFFRGVLPTQQHQDISDKDLEDQLIEGYDQLHQKYLKDKKSIPTGNLIELPFDKFIQEPLAAIQACLEQFEIPMKITNTAREKYQAKTRQKSAQHQVDAYTYSQVFLDKINQHLSPYFELFQYKKIVHGHA